METAGWDAALRIRNLHVNSSGKVVQIRHRHPLGGEGGGRGGRGMGRRGRGNEGRGGEDLEFAETTLGIIS